MTRSEVRRLRLVDVEQVRHHQEGQEWVPHWHEAWSFGAIVAGRCRCSVGGRPLVCESGDLVAIAPGVVHTGALTVPQDRDAVLVVMFYVPVEALAAMGLSPPACSGRTRDPALAAQARGLATAADVQAWLAGAVAVLGPALSADGAPADRRPSPATRQLLVRVQAAVEAGERTVAGLADRCGISRERLHRVLTDSLGIAPGDYLRAVRLHRARERLLAGEPLAEVAAGCGFADQSHFTRWFRRSFGYTPGDLAAATKARPGTGS